MGIYGKLGSSWKKRFKRIVKGRIFWRCYCTNDNVMMVVVKELKWNKLLLLLLAPKSKESRCDFDRTDSDKVCSSSSRCRFCTIMCHFFFRRRSNDIAVNFLPRSISRVWRQMSVGAWLNTASAETAAAQVLSEGLTNPHRQLHLYLAPSCPHQHRRRRGPDGWRPAATFNANWRKNTKGAACVGRHGGEVVHVSPA